MHVKQPELSEELTSEWAICDEIVQLRAWGTDVAYPMPRVPAPRGAPRAAVLDLLAQWDAQAQRVRAGWLVRCRGDKSELMQDGARRELVLLRPGIELGLGGLTLVAESARYIELRRFLARLLGWEQHEAIELALRNLRLAAARRVHIVLCGRGDLVPLAAAIARRTHNARPFIVCDPRRGTSSRSAHKPPNVTGALAALAAARGGTVCMWRQRLPSDFVLARDELRTRGRGQLFVCSPHRDDDDDEAGARITIPSLSDRSHELPRIINEYADEAISSLHASIQWRDEDRDWIATHSATSLLEIATGTLRLVALRDRGTINAAAQLLDLSHVSLGAWFQRRRAPRRG